MVERMKKYCFLIYYNSYDKFLENIQEAGVVHIIEKQKGIPDQATELRQQLGIADSLKNTIRAFQRRIEKQQNADIKPADPDIDGLSILKTYEQVRNQYDQLKLQQQGLQKEIHNMSVWGNFDLANLEKLESSGYRIRFYSARERDLKPEWKDMYNVMEINRIGTVIYFITFTPVNSEEEPDAEKIKLPVQSLSELEAALQANISQVETLDRQMDQMAADYLKTLKETHRQSLETIDVSKVHLHIEKKADDKLILLEGWVPVIKEKNLIEVLENQDVYYIGQDPDKDDNSVPILLKNNWFARLYEPIGELYDLPNYHEIDLTPFFAPFFMMFFGLCLGDAGYGLLLLVVALVAYRKVKPSMQPMIKLVGFLGLGTIVFGTISGTFFGIGLLDVQWPWIQSLKKFMLDSNQLFNLALIIGAVQIIFGMFIKAFGIIRRYGWKYSLETWGWLILILGGGALYLSTEKALLPPDTARYICYGVVAVAGICIFILNTPGRNPFINIGAGLWNTYNMVTGLLGDLLSYIRLFALGICGAVLGFAFNDLAIQLSGDIPVVSQIIMLIILLIGHSLNIFMSGLGAFVHPMRLTFVEFYKNAGFEGGGKKYKPLKHISVED